MELQISSLRLPKGDEGLPIIDGDVCPDLGLMFEEGEEEAAMVEDEVQDVE